MSFGRPNRVVLPRKPGAGQRWARGSQAVTRRPVRVVELLRETPRAVTLVLEPADGRPLHFRAGQYLTHCFEIDGQPYKRAYSMSSPESGRLCCTVQLLDDGVVSGYIARRLKVGDQYQVLGPTGDFVLDLESNTPLACVAGGSGITPVISLIETALLARPTRVVRLVYASRDQHNIIFRQRLEALTQRHPSFSVVHVLSKPEAGWTGERGRLSGSRLLQLLEAPPDARYYLCGPDGLIETAEQALRGAGVDAQQIRHERFIAAPRAARDQPKTPQPVLFQTSQRRIQQQPGETLLDAGLREGVGLRYSCTVGGCAACRVRVLSGAVAVNEPNCLTPEERAQGYTLACSAYALEPVVIEA